MSSGVSGTIQLAEGELYFETAGSGENVVLGHAGFLDSRMFDPVWEQLAEQYRVIRYDMRGYGKSGDTTAPVCRRRELRQLLASLNVTRAHMVGCSMGGEIALDIAAEEPNFVTSLTMIGSTPSGYPLEGEPPRFIMDMFAALQQGDFDRGGELQIRIWFDGPTREPEEVNQHQRADAMAMNRAVVERGAFLIADMQPLDPLAPPALERMATVTMPALIMVGALDDPAIVGAADYLANALPNASKVVIPGSAHVPSFERPELVLPPLLAFLKKARTT